MGDQRIKGRELKVLKRALTSALLFVALEERSAIPTHDVHYTHLKTIMGT